MFRPLSSLSLSTDEVNLLETDGFLSVTDIENAPIAASKFIDQQLKKNITRPPPVILTALDYWQAELQYERLTTFSKELDMILGGGFQCGTITEICGYSGSGKTQICFQISLTVQLSKNEGGLDGKSLYIDTKNAFSTQRLEDMIQGCKKMYPYLKLNEDKLMEGISIISLLKAQKLFEIFENLKEYLKTNPGIRVIIINSLTYPVVCSFNEPSSRTKYYVNLFHILQNIASKYNIAIIVTSELSTRTDSKGEICIVSTAGSTVAHRTHKRIMLTRISDLKFAAKIIKSTTQSQKIVPFYITKDGIRDDL